MGFISPKDAGWLTERIAAVAEPLCQAEGIELVHIEHSISNKEKIVRLYMDKAGGIALADCVAVSRQLGDLIDVQIDNIGSYRLEVSSPGLNRPLSKKEHFQRFTGERVKIETHESVDGRRKFTGILEKTNDDSVTVAVDGKMVEIAAIMISKAMLAGQ